MDSRSFFPWLFLALLTLGPGRALPADPPATSNRIEALTNYHGYFPCMDCHAEQEPVTTPRILEEEHAEPLEWEDDQGKIHRVTFGQKVALADLLGLTETTDLYSTNLALIGNRLNISQYMENQGLAPADSVWALVHGGGNLWCLDCHQTEDRDKLIRFNQDPITFNESHLLCGECHGPKLRDWELGIHGKTTGFWDASQDLEAASLRLLCVECHPAHNPAFPAMLPEPGPVARLAGPGKHPLNAQETGDHQEDSH